MDRFFLILELIFMHFFNNKNFKKVEEINAWVSPVFIMKHINSSNEPISYKPISKGPKIILQGNKKDRVYETFYLNPVIDSIIVDFENENFIIYTKK